MKRTLTTLFLALATVSAPFGTSAQAQQQSIQTTETAQLKTEVVNRLNKKEERVKIKLRNGSELKGRISQTNENGFTLTDEKTSARTDIAYADVLNVEGRGMSKTKKVLIGSAIGVGVVIAVVAYALTHLFE